MENTDSSQTAALYIRVSTDEQVQGYSLEAQKSALYEHCRNTKTGVYKLYVDAGRSGKSISGRPSLLELLEDARSGHFRQVICLRLNRLSRKLGDLLHMTEHFDKLGVTLHSLTEKLDTATPMGKFALQMLGSVAEHERRQIGQNVRLGMLRRNKLGKWNSGNQVLGYRWVPRPKDKRLSRVEVVAEEAKLVNRIFEWYASGLGLKAIVNRLNGSGHRTKKGKAFHIVSLRGILTNVNYIGKIAYTDSDISERKKTADGQHDGIVSTELWERVQRQLAERSHPPTKRIKHSFPLSGLLKCPACGSSMIAAHTTRKRKDGSKRIDLYYVCSSYNSRGHTVCRPHHVRADRAEDWLAKQIQQFLSRPAVAEQLTEEINGRREKKLKPLRRKVEEINSQIASLKKRSLRCYELFEDGHIDSRELKTRLDGVQSEIALFKQEQDNLVNIIASSPDQTIPSDRVRKVLNHFRPILDQAKPEQRKALFHNLIDKIVLPPNRDIDQAIIYGSDALLHLNIPVIPVKGVSQA